MRIHLGNFFKDPAPIESYKHGNFPKAVRDEAADQLTRGSIALAQYKQDYEDEAYINHLMEADLRNLLDELVEIRDNAQCFHVMFMSMLMISRVQKIIANKDFDLNNLLKS